MIGAGPESRWWLPPALFAAAIAVAALAAKLGAPALLCAALAGPVYYGLPLGVGLLVVRPLQSALTRTQHALLAYFCGLVLICAVMVVREHGVPAEFNLHAFASLIVLAALAGFAVGHRVFVWNAAAKSAATDFGVVLPVFAVDYAVRYGIFSDFPVTDLFQATHLMKGALEFGRFDVLNPFTAGSYVPIIQTLEGLLVRYLGLDPLAGAWILPAFATLPKFLACRAAFQSVLRDRGACLFATAAAACFFSAITPTNGELTVLGSLLVLSLAAGTAADGRLRTSVLVVVVGFLGLGLGYVVTRTVPLIYIAGLGAVGLLPYAAARLRVPRALFALPIVCVALAPIHRSALAFVPMALVLGAVMPLAIAWVQVGAEARHRRLVAAVVSLTAVAGFAIAALLGWVMLNPADDMRETGPGGWLVETILGATPTKANILAGSGPKVALFELARAVLPSLALFSGILLALSVVARRPAALGLVAWALAVALGSLLLIGVPFVYRSGFLVITLLIVALVAGWQSLGQGDAGSLRRATMAAAGAYVLLAIPMLYRCGALSRCERSEYLDLARTPLTVLGLLVLAGAAAGALSRRARALALVAPAVVVLLFVLESQVSRAFFMHHSYGEKEFSASRAVSHLSPQEVELAGVVRAMGNHLVVVSDPYTMSNIRALTGLNSLITYSNLDTLSPVGMVRLREWLKETVAPSGGRKSCAPRHPLQILDHTVNTAEFNYWLARSASPEVPASEVLREFGLRDTFFTTVHPSRKGVPDRFPDHEWRKPLIARLEARFPGEPAILLVVDSKTIRWARGDEDVDYFPDVKPLEHDFVAQLEKHCGARIHDGRFGLIRFPMAGQ